MGKIINRIVAGAILSIGIVRLLVVLYLLPDFRALKEFKKTIWGLGIGARILLLLVLQAYIFYMGYSALMFFYYSEYRFKTLACFAIAIVFLIFSHIYYTMLWQNNYNGY